MAYFADCKMVAEHFGLAASSVQARQHGNPSDAKELLPIMQMPIRPVAPVFDNAVFDHAAEANSTSAGGPNWLNCCKRV